MCFITEDQRQPIATVVKFQVLLKVHQKLHFLWRKHPADLRSLNMDVALQIMAASANLPSFQLGGSSVPSFLFSQWYPRGVKLWTPHATYWEVGLGVFKSWAAESVECSDCSTRIGKLTVSSVKKSLKLNFFIHTTKPLNIWTPLIALSSPEPKALTRNWHARGEIQNWRSYLTSPLSPRPQLPFNYGALLNLPLL